MSKKTRNTKRRNTKSDRGDIKMSIKDWIVEKVGVSFLKPLWDKLEGKKTYIIMGITVIFAGIDTWNAHCGVPTNLCKELNVPVYVYGILATLGIYTRAVVKPK